MGQTQPTQYCFAAKSNPRDVSTEALCLNCQFDLDPIVPQPTGHDWCIEVGLSVLILHTSSLGIVFNLHQLMCHSVHIGGLVR